MTRRGDRPVRVYHASVQLRRKVLRAASATFDGFWLGMFDRRETLALLDEAFYDTGGGTSDDHGIAYASERWVTRGLDAWEDAAVSEHFPPGGRVVVTGAGGGREVLALLGRGFDAVGYEPHARLVADGDRVLAGRGHPGRLHLSERDIFPDGAGPYDAVLVGHGSYTLIPSRKRRVSFLRAARETLSEGDPILLSFFTRRDEERTIAVVHRTASVVRRLRRADPPELGDLLVPNYGHAFDEAEVAGELADGGFELLRFAERPYGHAVGRASSRSRIRRSAR